MIKKYISMYVMPPEVYKRALRNTPVGNATIDPTIEYGYVRQTLSTVSSMGGIDKVALDISNVGKLRYTDELASKWKAGDGDVLLQKEDVNRFLGKMQNAQICHRVAQVNTALASFGCESVG